MENPFSLIYLTADVEPVQFNRNAYPGSEGELCYLSLTRCSLTSQTWLIGSCPSIWLPRTAQKGFLLGYWQSPKCISRDVEEHGSEKSAESAEMK